MILNLFFRSSVSSAYSDNSSKIPSPSHENHSLNENSHLLFSNQNKENILLNKKSSPNKLDSTNAESAEQNLNTKMPPVKLPGRQTNNSLSSITGNIVIQQTAAANPPPATNSNTSSSTPRKKVSAKTEL